MNTETAPKDAPEDSPEDAPEGTQDAPQKGTVAPRFDAPFLEMFDQLVRWRRDVRRFRTDPLPDQLLEDLLSAAMLSPSVGNAQPWRWVVVDDAERRAAIQANFAACNQEALAGYSGEKAEIYAGLKLAGLEKSPAHVAVFADLETERGSGLGRQTMPEMLAYSVVGAVQTLWLVARANGVGLGWVSILDLDQVSETLDVPDTWRLIAYLCLGYPEEEHTDPELQRAGWQARDAAEGFIYKR